MSHLQQNIEELGLLAALNATDLSTTVEAKALCSVLRKAESQGERALVEKMIEICDSQSGLRFGELWDWWKKHKQQDSLKFSVSKFQHVSIPLINPNTTKVVC